MFNPGLIWDRSVKYVDSVETDTHIYIATERVRPLEGVLRDWEIGGALSGSSTAKGKGKEDWIGWGVRSLSVSHHDLFRQDNCCRQRDDC